MQRIKAVFISAYAAMAMAILLSAVVVSVRAGIDLGWIGAALSVAPFMTVVGYLMIMQSKARTSRDLPVATTLSLTGALVAIVAAVRYDAAPIAVACAIAGAAGHLVYVYWYSKLDRPQAPGLRLGGTLPDLSLETSERGPVTTHSLRGHPTIYLFFRGNWCPLCMAQIKEVAAQYRALAARGAVIVLVSPQPHESTAQLAARFDVPMRFLVDPGNRAARALGIDAPGGVPLVFGVLGYDEETVLPTVIITDARGMILFVDQTDNYRIRPEPATFAAVLDQAIGPE